MSTNRRRSLPQTLRVFVFVLGTGIGRIAKDISPTYDTAQVQKIADHFSLTQSVFQAD
jgi:hypothetical protein